MMRILSKACTYQIGAHGVAAPERQQIGDVVRDLVVVLDHAGGVLG